MYLLQFARQIAEVLSYVGVPGFAVRFRGILANRSYSAALSNSSAMLSMRLTSHPAGDACPDRNTRAFFNAKRRFSVPIGRRTTQGPVTQRGPRSPGWNGCKCAVFSDEALLQAGIGSTQEG